MIKLCIIRVHLAEDFKTIKIKAEADSEIDEHQDNSDDDDDDNADFFYISNNESDYLIESDNDDLTNNTGRTGPNNIINLSGSRDNFLIKVNEKTSDDFHLLKNNINYSNKNDLDDDRNPSLSLIFYKKKGFNVINIVKPTGKKVFKF